MRSSFFNLIRYFSIPFPGSESNVKDDSLLEMGDLGPETTEVTLIVLKITFGAKNNDTIEVFKDPDSLWDEQQCSPQVVGNGDSSAVLLFRLRATHGCHSSGEREVQPRSTDATNLTGRTPFQPRQCRLIGRALRRLQRIVLCRGYRPATFL